MGCLLGAKSLQLHRWSLTYDPQLSPPFLSLSETAGGVCPILQPFLPRSLTESVQFLSESHGS